MPMHLKDDFKKVVERSRKVASQLSGGIAGLMKKNKIDYYFIALLTVIAVFVAFKWQHLGLPYFWDEAWVYAPAVLEINKNGVC